MNALAVQRHYIRNTRSLIGIARRYSSDGARGVNDDLAFFPSRRIEGGGYF